MSGINQKIIKHFEKNDKVLFSIMKDIQVKETPLVEPKDYFIRLCREIIGQQLASGAVKAIFSRFKDLSLNKKVTPRKVLNISHDELRKVGLSNAKALSIRDLAERIESKELDLKGLKDLSDKEAMIALTKVRGIGPWTAEMFLMFALKREDVFSPGDLGLRKAIHSLYNLKQRPTEEEAEKISQKWKPYRTYASLVLWRSLNS